MAEGQSRTLKTPTYLGLVFSQFLAAFNDQAVHIIAVFYAGDMLVRYAHVAGLAEKHVVFWVPVCFVAPFFLFSPLAGVLADKYSKRTIVVFWKIAEVAIMAIALVGFLLPQFAEWGWGEERTLAILSALIVVFAVFLMGTHSAFFVPAKYGIMPEILHPAVLSKGNGFLEGSSFLAQILGTSFGGFLYGPLKPTFVGDDLEAGNAWIIGVVLFILAVIGAAAAFVMRPVPAAAGDRKFTLNPFGPLANNLRVVWRTRPLVLAITGIAFFTGMTFFLRQGLLYEGETSKDLHAARHQAASLESAAAKDDRPPGAEETEAFVPDASEAQQAEMRVALLVAFIGLGVGVGSWLAGYLSGPKIELGLVPIGASFIALATLGLAAVTYDGGSTTSTIICLIMIGVAAGLYIVPLYSLLQHRAPKQSKGSLVATSNFVNSTAGLVAMGTFFVLTTALENMLGVGKHIREAIGGNSDLIENLEAQMNIPRLLFLTAALVTVAILFVLRRQLPDFFLRSAVWLRTYGKSRLNVHHVHNLPSTGPVILLSDAPNLMAGLHVGTITDRTTQLIVVEPEVAERAGNSVIRFLMRHSGNAIVDPTTVRAEMWQKLTEAATATLRGGHILAIAAPAGVSVPDIDRLIEEARRGAAVSILPVHYEIHGPPEQLPSPVHMVLGAPMATEAPPAEARMILANPAVIAA